MGAQFRCGHCKRGLSWQIYCPLRDMETARCVMGDPPEKLWPHADPEAPADSSYGDKP